MKQETQQIQVIEGTDVEYTDTGSSVKLQSYKLRDTAKDLGKSVVLFTLVVIASVFTLVTWISNTIQRMLKALFKL